MGSAVTDPPQQRDQRSDDDDSAEPPKVPWVILASGPLVGYACSYDSFVEGTPRVSPKGFAGE